MKIIFFPDAKGVISIPGRIVGQQIPDGAVIADFEGEMDLAPATAAVLRDGEVSIVGNFVGSGPWYDQRASLADRETPHAIEALGIVPPNDLGQPVSQGWENMAMTPRPLTKAEVAAQAKAEAEAKAAAEAEARNARTITPIQFNKAMIVSGLKAEFRAALSAAGKSETEVEIAMADIEYVYEPLRFDNPEFVASANLLGKSEADREAFWRLAMSL